MATTVSGSSTKSDGPYEEPTTLLSSGALPAGVPSAAGLLPTPFHPCWATMFIASGTAASTTGPSSTKAGTTDPGGGPVVKSSGMPGNHEYSGAGPPAPTAATGPNRRCSLPSCTGGTVTGSRAGHTVLPRSGTADPSSTCNPLPTITLYLPKHGPSPSPY